jgi:hypothetical protein
MVWLRGLAEPDFCLFALQLTRLPGLVTVRISFRITGFVPDFLCLSSKNEDIDGYTAKNLSFWGKSLETTPKPKAGVSDR